MFLLYGVRRWVLLAIVAAFAACAPPDQESVRTVAAVEVPLRTAADRNELVAILRRHATAGDGLHVDDVTAEWIDFEAQMNTVAPSERGSIFVGVWLGANNDELVADVGDSGHRGRVWITFVKGQHPDIAAKFRATVITEVARTWPDAQPLPVLPSGGLALPADLRMTPAGYKIDAAAAAKYDLPVSSPLVAKG
jgi:hypothetical protein